MQVKILIWLLIPVLFLAACSSGSPVDDPGENNEPYEPIIADKPPFTGQPGDPGFFLDHWTPLQAEIPPHQPFEKPDGNPVVKVFADTEDIITKVPPGIFGNNANIYMGQMVTEPDLLTYISDLSPNIIRFPGGNISNLYFWNANPGDFPDDIPKELPDANGVKSEVYYWPGNNQQSWTITLDNFYEMLNLTSSTAMITVNYSYARYGTGPNPVQTAAKLAADWVRYDNGRTRYWEIGNENHGTWQSGYLIDTSKNQDGQPERISGELYGRHFIVFADSMRAAAAEIGADIKIGAQLLQEHNESWHSQVDRTWNEGYFTAAGEYADFYIMHDYYTPYNTNSSPDEILNTAAPVTYNNMKYLNETFERHNAEVKPLAFTEWNIFAVGSNQMVSDISGIHASMVVGEMLKNSYAMAARWNFANGWDNGNDHGMFNIGDEPGGIPKWNPRPDFYHLYFMQRVFGDTMIFSWEQGEYSSDISSYVSLYESGETGVVIANIGNADKLIEVEILNYNPGKQYYWYTISGEGGEFSRSVSINGREAHYESGGPLDYKEVRARSAETGGGIKINVPGKSVTYMLIE